MRINIICGQCSAENGFTGCLDYFTPDGVYKGVCLKGPS